MPQLPLTPRWPPRPRGSAPGGCASPPASPVRRLAGALLPPAPLLLLVCARLRVPARPPLCALALGGFAPLRLACSRLPLAPARNRPRLRLGLLSGCQKLPPHFLPLAAPHPEF